jgi:hypothetical protein
MIMLSFARGPVPHTDIAGNNTLSDCWIIGRKRPAFLITGKTKNFSDLL